MLSVLTDVVRSEMGAEVGRVGARTLRAVWTSTTGC
jgi:hypothetical protein